MPQVTTTANVGKQCQSTETRMGSNDVPELKWLFELLLPSFGSMGNETKIFAYFTNLGLLVVSKVL